MCSHDAVLTVYNVMITKLDVEGKVVVVGVFIQKMIITVVQITNKSQIFKKYRPI